MVDNVTGNNTRITPAGVRRTWQDTFLDKWVMPIAAIGAVLLIIGACLVFLNQTKIALHHAQLNSGGHTKFENLGSFVGGVSLFIGALLVWLEATLINRHTASRDREIQLAAASRDREIQQAERIAREASLTEQRYISAVTSFRALYQEFWGEPIVSEVRRWIISEEEYKPIKCVLIERNNDPSKNGNKLRPEANLKLDKLDRFLSTLVRIRSFNLSEEYKFINDPQKILWNKVINREFWITFIYENREELWTYLYNHWRDDLLPLNAPERYDPDVKLQF
jgi:hypothetical protein